MSEPTLPPCGLYKTTRAIGAVPAGRLVYFHNHGDPGPGVYLPASWKQNRAQFHAGGTTLPSPEDASSLEPLAAEGLYVVREAFHCCDKKCVAYAPGMLVQLGYQGSAQALLFVPRWVQGSFTLPEQGNAVDAGVVTKLEALRVPDELREGAQDAPPPGPDEVLH
ncbi:MAG: hypothetical protein R3B40_29855 [Polyangiales bacterium]